LAKFFESWSKDVVHFEPTGQLGGDIDSMGALCGLIHFL
jgi:hypothetical protein